MEMELPSSPTLELQLANTNTKWMLGRYDCVISLGASFFFFFGGGVVPFWNKNTWNSFLFPDLILGSLEC